MTRTDSEGRDVTDLPGLWSENDTCEQQDHRLNKPLHEMSDSEFLFECSILLSQMCDRMKLAHEQLAKVALETKNNGIARPILEFPMRTCLYGVGDILNGIDLVDEESSERSAPMFAELRRRFPIEP